jgi:hypothetical protein
MQVLGARDADTEPRDSQHIAQELVILRSPYRTSAWVRRWKTEADGINATESIGVRGNGKRNTKKEKASVECVSAQR